jgi:hypothetical protein
MRVLHGFFCILLAVSSFAEEPDQARERYIRIMADEPTGASFAIEAIGQLGGDQVDAALPQIIKFVREHPEAPYAAQKLMEIVREKDTPVADDIVEELRVLVANDTSSNAYGLWQLINGKQQSLAWERQDQEDQIWRKMIEEMNKAPDSSVKKIVEISQLGDKQFDRAMVEIVNVLGNNPDAPGGLLQLLRSVEQKKTPVTNDQIMWLQRLVRTTSGEEHELLQRLKQKNEESKTTAPSDGKDR